jgi:23S rRNA (uracil1939-C5)-methyltransferase
MDDRTLTIEKVVHGGKGLSRDLQQIVFVPLTLPGEKVRVRITATRRDFLEAEPVEIVEPSPDRVSPACRYYGHCGGCQLMHAAYDLQVRLKTAILRETLSRNKLRFPEIQTISGAPLAYRHRAQIKVDPRHARLGFFERETSRIVDVKECLCLTPGLNRLLPLLREVLQAAPVRGLSEIECYENNEGRTVVYLNVPPPEQWIQRLGDRTTIVGPRDLENTALTWRFREFELPMRPDVFMQINACLWKHLIQEVECHHDKDKSRDRIMVELYCGAGFFTLPLSERFARILACEENASAIRLARERYPGRNIDWKCARAEEFAVPSEASVALVDPPRAGLHKKVIERILTHPFEKISYVSCDAASLGRDLKALSPKYVIDRLTLIDLFPQTSHFETVVLLRPHPLSPT